jgi:hypothetical protein
VIAVTMTDGFGRRLRERRSIRRIEHLDKENLRLRNELGSMRSLMEQERSDKSEILDALRQQPTTVVKKKRGGFVRMLVVGGGAYVLGSRAGRERYDQIMEWTKRMRDRGREATDDIRGELPASA